MTSTRNRFKKKQALKLQNKSTPTGEFLKGAFIVKGRSVLNQGVTLAGGMDAVSELKSLKWNKCVYDNNNND